MRTRDLDSQVEFHGGSVPRGGLPQRFEEWGHRIPDATAVVFEGSSTNWLGTPIGGRIDWRIG